MVCFVDSYFPRLPILLTKGAPKFLLLLILFFLTIWIVIKKENWGKAQFCFCGFVVVECHLLMTMSHNHCVFICTHLLYRVTMSYQVCSWMVTGLYGRDWPCATAQTVLLLRVLFCNVDVINHYFCHLFLLL